MRRLFCVCLLAAVAAPMVSAGEKLSYVDLVDRLTDMEHLALLPARGETCKQWSSYDRRSKYDSENDNYVAWEANGDGNGFIRKEDGQLVFAEMEGPGCIWRIWSALAKQGHVKIYLDGNPEPAVDLAFDDYFNCKVEPFVYPALVHTTARGRNNYVPIPYQKSCKIVGEGDWGRYYQFVYTTYPKGTQVPTFTRDLSRKQQDALKRANDILSGSAKFDKLIEEREGKTIDVTAPAGKTARVAKLSGPKAITAMHVNMELPDDEDEQRRLLREVVLRIRWDGEEKPGVWAPVGDFFGSAPGVNNYKSLPLGMTDDGFYSTWYMPFGKSAEIDIVNGSEQAVTADFRILTAPLKHDIDELGYFHAWWHRDEDLEPDRRRIDWTMLKTEGRGRFCGVMLHVWNPRGGWWGEGDEKFFVDGEKFPSTFGTGSEDYFGYAWCNPTLFQNCYHNQTCCTNNKGHASVNRWQISDNIPFQKSFNAAIEKYYPNEKPKFCKYACTAYWYQAPVGETSYESIPPEERHNYWVGPKIYRVKGVVEGEKLEVLRKTGGNVQIQAMTSWPPHQWSGEAQLWWTNGKPGEKVELNLPSKAGKFDLKIRFTKAIDYGIVAVLLDGKQLGDPIDLFHDGVIPTEEISFGVQELDAGDHTLTLKLTGTNPKAVKKFMVGVDYAKLVPAE